MHPAEEPDTLPADTGDDYPHLRAWLRARRLTSHLACRGVDTSARLGRHCWQVGSTLAYLVGDRRLATCCGRHPDRCCALLTFGAAFTCDRRLTL